MLILVETTDVVFAVDSVPAILAVAGEQFIVFTSNALAILGLRALYFLLGRHGGKFRYLNVGLGVILAFVGVKMLLTEVYHLPTWLSLSVIILVLTLAIVASLRADSREHDADDSVEHELDVSRHEKAIRGDVLLGSALLTARLSSLGLTPNF